MPIPESVIRPILAEYENTRAKNAAVRDEHVQEVYQALPRIHQIDEYLSSTALRLFTAIRKNPSKNQEIVAAVCAENEALTAEKKKLMAEAGFPADYLELHYDCPDCQDTGFIGQKKCHCMHQALIKAAYQSSNVGSLIEKDNFSTFDLSVFSDEIASGASISPRQNAEKIRKAVMDWIWHFDSNPGTGLLFYGNPGTGKTFFLSCIAKEMMDQGHTVLYMSAYDLCDILSKRRFIDRYPEAEAQKVLSRCEMIESCDLLIIDDLGTEFATQMSIADLIHCIDLRMVNGKPVIISTNLTPNQLAQNYSERFASRVCGQYKIFRMYGADLRFKK